MIGGVKLGLISTIRGWFKKMIPLKSIEKALGITDATPPERKREQDEWQNVLNGRAEWNTDKVISMRLASSSCKEVARAATTTFESSITGSPFADFINVQYQKAINNIYDIAFSVCSNGKIILKPFVYNGEICTRIVVCGEYIPFQYDPMGKLTGVVFVEKTQYDDKFYTLAEKCLLEDGIYTVEYAAWVSANESDLGRPIDLSVVPKWSNLIPSVEWHKATQPGFVELSIRDGCPIFADGIELIREADMLLSYILHESKHGKLKMFADRDLFIRDKYGNPIGVETDFIQVLQASGTSDGSKKPLLDAFSPDLRIAQFNEGLNIILRHYETAVGLSKATFSDPQQQAKTAEEVRASKPRFSDTVSNLQEKVLQPAMMELIRVIAEIAARYKVVPFGRIELETTYFYWDKTYLITKEEEREAHIKELAVLEQLVALGLAPEHVIAYWNNVSDDFPKITEADLKAARAKMGSTFEPLEE